MPDWLSIVGRPLTLFALLVLALGISALLYRFIPDGPVKRFLYAKHVVIPTNEAERRDRVGGNALLLAGVVVVVFLLWVGVTVH